MSFAEAFGRGNAAFETAMHLEHGKFDNPRPELRSVVAESLHWVDADAARQFRDPSRDASPALPRESRPHPLGPEAANGGDTVAMDTTTPSTASGWPTRVSNTRSRRGAN